MTDKLQPAVAWLRRGHTYQLCATKMPHTIPTTVVPTTNNPRQSIVEATTINTFLSRASKLAEKGLLLLFCLFCLFVLFCFCFWCCCFCFLLLLFFLFFLFFLQCRPLKSDRIINLLIAVASTEEDEIEFRCVCIISSLKQVGAHVSRHRTMIKVCTIKSRQQSSLLNITCANELSMSFNKSTGCGNIPNSVQIHTWISGNMDTTGFHISCNCVLDW